MRHTLLAAILAFSFFSLAMNAAEAPPPVPAAPKTQADIEKIRNEALTKALNYIHTNLRSNKVPRSIGSQLNGYVFSGLALLMAENEPTKDLEDCVKYCCRAIKDDYFNRNWYLSMCMFFLTEYSMKYGLKPHVETALREAFKTAEAQQEETGGWCHHLKFWAEGDYNKKGGGKDLSMCTSLIYGSMLQLKTLGIENETVREKAFQNLKTISDKFGFEYGTDNKVGDTCMGRSSYTLISILGTKTTDHPFYERIARGLQERFRRCDDGHASPPLHYFGVAAAMHRLGPETYDKFYNYYADTLISLQAEDGSAFLNIKPGAKKDDLYDAPGQTAVFACILMMKKPGIFVWKSKAELAKAAAPVVKPMTLAVQALKEPEIKITDAQLKPWNDALKQMVIKNVTAKPVSNVTLSIIGKSQTATIVAADDVNLTLEAGGGKIQTPWKFLSGRQDLLNLARACARQDSANEQILVAVFSLANNGSKADAAKFLDKAREVEPANAAALIDAAIKPLNVTAPI